jgi:hypothetical protein
MGDLGYYGNIWVRQHSIPKAGGRGSGGHTHLFDHVTLLVKGSVSVEVEGEEPKEFTAPTFIVIRKEKRHGFTALVDDVIYYCVFAMRNINGEVVDDIYNDHHDPIPWSAAAVEKSHYAVDVKKIQDI